MQINDTSILISIEYKYLSLAIFQSIAYIGFSSCYTGLLL